MQRFTSFGLQNIVHESELFSGCWLRVRKHLSERYHFFTSHFLCHQDAIELSEGHAFVEESGVVLVLVEVIAVLAIPCQTHARGVCIVVKVYQAQQLFVERRPLCAIGVVLDSDLVPPWLIR